MTTIAARRRLVIFERVLEPASPGTFISTKDDLKIDPIMKTFASTDIAVGYNPHRDTITREASIRPAHN